MGKRKSRMTGINSAGVLNGKSYKKLGRRKRKRRRKGGGWKEEERRIRGSEDTC